MQHAESKLGQLGFEVAPWPCEVQERVPRSPLLDLLCPTPLLQKMGEKNGVVNMIGGVW